MLQFIKSLSHDERGVTALEYAVLAAIVVVAVVAAGTILSSTSNGLPSLFTSLMNTISSHI